MCQLLLFALRFFPKMFSIKVVLMLFLVDPDQRCDPVGTKNWLNCFHMVFGMNIVIIFLGEAGRGVGMFG